MKYVSREKEFTLLIGEGLSIFGRAEMELANLFVVAVQAANPKTAERVFWSVNSLEVRTAMTNAALKEIWPVIKDSDTLKTEWAQIAQTIPKLASKRAELAHGNWAGFAWLDRRGNQKIDQFFAPYYGKASVDMQTDYTQPGFDPRPGKRLYEPDLEKRKQEFSVLGMELSHLRSRVRFWLEQPDSTPEQAALLTSPPAHPSASQKKRGK